MSKKGRFAVIDFEIYYIKRSRVMAINVRKLSGAHFIEVIAVLSVEWLRVHGFFLLEPVNFGRGSLFLCKFWHNLSLDCS